MSADFSPRVHVFVGELQNSKSDNEFTQFQSNLVRLPMEKANSIASICRNASDFCRLVNEQGSFVSFLHFAILSAFFRVFFPCSFFIYFRAVMTTYSLLSSLFCLCVLFRCEWWRRRCWFVFTVFVSFCI